MLLGSPIDILAIMINYGSCSCLSFEQDFLDPIKTRKEVVLLIPIDDVEEDEIEIIEVHEETGDNNEEEDEGEGEESETDATGNEE